MMFLEVLSRIISILVGLATLVEKSKSYIKRQKTETGKDPSASWQAPDGSDEDRLSDQ